MHDCAYNFTFIFYFSAQRLLVYVIHGPFFYPHQHNPAGRGRPPGGRGRGLYGVQIQSSGPIQNCEVHIGLSSPLRVVF